jgi:hypothetical protein
MNACAEGPDERGGEGSDPGRGRCAERPEVRGGKEEGSGVVVDGCGGLAA